MKRDLGPGSFLPYDRMGYADNNAADAQGAIATWVFGNANPKAAADNAALIAANSTVDTNDLEQDILSWTPIRDPKVAAARFTC